MRSAALVVIARVILILWTGFWAFFCIASAIGEQEGLAAGLVHQVPALVMIVSTAVAWRWQRSGAVLLLLEGGLIASGQLLRPSGFVFAALGLPPLLSGLLLLIAAPSAPPSAAVASSERLAG